MTTERKVPTKQQVLQAAKDCPQTAEALRILFPDDFRYDFNWQNFQANPFMYLHCITPDRCEPSDSLKAAYKSIRKPIPDHTYPRMTLSILAELINFLNDNYPE